MKKIKLFGMIVVACFSSVVYAVGSGGYFGANVGMASLEGKQPTTGESKTGSGFAGGVLFGANVNNYGGFELGINHYPNVKNEVIDVCNDTEVQTNALNILGKGMIPFASSGITLIGKGGIAGIRTTGPGDFRPSTGKCSTQSRTDVKPTLAIGASYDLTQTWVAELSYSRIFINNDFLKSANMFAVSLTYHWVDVYCGQFLC
jgi:hypothetical protein